MVPPVTVALAEPLFPPKQETLDCVIVMDNETAGVTVNVLLTLQVAASWTCTV